MKKKKIITSKQDALNYLKKMLFWKAFCKHHKKFEKSVKVLLNNDVKAFEEYNKISIETFIKALDGFYYKDKSDNIYYSSNQFIYVGNSLTGHFIRVYPTIDERDAHYFDWNKSDYVKLQDYGKTWSLNKEDLQ